MNENLNLCCLEIDYIVYRLLTTRRIRYAQHLACMRKRKLRTYLSKNRSLRDKCFLEARKLPRFCKTKKITIYNSRNWAGEIPAQSLIKHIS